MSTGSRVLVAIHRFDTQNIAVFLSLGSLGIIARSFPVCVLRWAKEKGNKTSSLLFILNRFHLAPNGGVFFPQ